ncbi:hypothetical protein ACWM35_22935 [Neobacillus sp. K501]
MKKVLMGISLSLLLLLTFVNSGNSQSSSNVVIKTEQTKVGHPILPPV